MAFFFKTYNQNDLFNKINLYIREDAVKAKIAIFISFELLTENIVVSAMLRNI